MFNCHVNSSQFLRHLLISLPFCIEYILRLLTYHVNKIAFISLRNKLNYSDCNHESRGKNALDEQKTQPVNFPKDRCEAMASCRLFG